MHTILGSTGVIGKGLATYLTEYTHDIKLVSRNPEKVNPSDELVTADLHDMQQADQAVKGSSVVYLTVGLKYQLKVWEKSWPVIMSNVISACKAHDAKLVFFDNVYMYDKDYLGNMTEDTPVNPPSKKGMIRAVIADMILNEVKQGRLKALIARSADFYGSGTDQSILTETVVKPLMKGATANWMGSPKYKHSFSYTPDAAKATAMLGNTDDAFNQIWHLPTASNPPTGEEMIQMIASELGVKPRYRTLSKTVIRTIGLFSPILREMKEMMYQNDRDYIFNSSKFEQRFKFKPTPYALGVKTMIKEKLKSFN